MKNMLPYRPDNVMITLVLVVLSLIIGGCVFFWRAEYPDHTVDRADLSKYMGRWYEIASFPNWFQKGCTCTTADYAPADGHVKVTNSCRRGSPQAKLDVATGKAYVVPNTHNAQLRVQSQWPFKGDYWVIALDEDYQYAMVGYPRKKYLWILSRSPSWTMRPIPGLWALPRPKDTRCPGCEKPTSPAAISQMENNHRSLLHVSCAANWAGN